MRLAKGILCTAAILAMGSHARGASCNALVGEWFWFTGYPVTLKADHSIVYDGKPAGKWTCTNPAKNAATLRWDSSFVDTVTVAGDNLHGVNQQGYKVWANRRRPAPDVKLPSRAAVPASGVPASPTNPQPPANGCHQGNWRQECERELPRFSSQGAISSCIMDKMAACGNLVP
jgi:hypothetical protein